MLINNYTEVTEIFLFGFKNFYSFNKAILFSMFLLIYCLTVCLNILIIVLVSTSKKLYSPMYVFLQQLSISDILHTTNIVPVMLKTIIYEGEKMTLVGCLTQMYLFGSLEGFQCLLLTVMSFDRYLAISNPLHYVSIMNQKLCFKLIIMSWLLILIIVMITMIAITKLHFCKNNTINHFFCDLEPLLELSCSDTKLVQMIMFLLVAPVIILPFTVIMASYVSIALAILKITTNEGKQKAFSTCSSHLTVVCLFFGTLFSVYVVPPRLQSLATNKILSLSYTVAIPCLNPIIYSFRSKDLKEAFLTKFLVNRVSSKKCRGLGEIR